MVPQQPRRRRICVNEEVYAQPGTVGLLTACTDSRREVFSEPEHAEVAVAEIKRLHKDRWWILGFCVMPDHVHLLLLNLNGALIDAMKLFKRRTAHRLRQNVDGSVWQRSFHDHLLRRNEDINATLLYPLENPVRAGLEGKWADYPWSGSLKWPNIDLDFFAVNPSNVMWSQIFARDL